MLPVLALAAMLVGPLPDSTRFAIRAGPMIDVDGWSPTSTTETIYQTWFGAITGRPSGQDGQSVMVDLRS